MKILITIIGLAFAATVFAQTKVNSRGDRVTVTAKDGPTVKLSEVTVHGSATWPGTANCVWTLNSASFDDMNVDNDCPTPTTTGFLSPPVSAKPEALMSIVTPGIYLVLFSGEMEASSAGTNDCSWRIQFAGQDGSPISGIFQNNAVTNGPSSKENQIISVFTVTSQLTNVEVKVQNARTGSGGDCQIDNNGVTLEEVRFDVIKLASF